MQDRATTVEQLKQIAAQFIEEREWNQYHAPKNLSMNLAVEAAELMEKFLWHTTAESFEEVEKNRQEIENELADVLFSILCFANATKVDLSKAFAFKLREIDKKYPIEKVKGKHEKYTKYQEDKKTFKSK